MVSLRIIFITVLALAAVSMTTSACSTQATIDTTSHSAISTQPLAANTVTEDAPPAGITRTTPDPATPPDEKDSAGEMVTLEEAGAPAYQIIINNPGNFSYAGCYVGSPGGDAIKIRTGPGQDYTVFGLLVTPARYIGSEGEWHQIRLPGGSTGWVSGTVTARIGTC